jgi:LAO/AO transport system kinase
VARGAEPVAELVEAAAAGRQRAVARLISLVEDAAAAQQASPRLREAIHLLSQQREPGRTAVIGLTGSPGVGKSTTTAALVGAFRARGDRVGVLAVDPSSPFSGGALLGDRVRMQDHALDADVFIRSMASRGRLGGLAWATPQALLVLEAAGCDVVLIETVGVGQAEVEIASLADTTVVLLAPGMGDAIQAAKAGILEVGDVFVVNKADRDGADRTVREVKGMLALGGAASGWTPAVCRTVASKNEGIAELVEALDRHRDHLRTSGELDRRRTARARGEIEAIAVADLLTRVAELRGRASIDELAGAVAAGTLDPYEAADRVVAEVRPGAPS